MSKILSYSLWGKTAMFLHGAIVNAKQCREFFPDWTMRLYYNDSVPSNIIETLKSLGVELIRVDRDGTYGTFWRFRPLFENHERVFVRDIDSRITWRDVRCVNEWIESGKKYIVVRDHDEHYKTSIMAGLFGVRGSVPSSVIPIMDHYAHIHHYISDQVFLDRHVWDIMKGDLQEFGFREIPWMTESWTVDNHMGIGFDENDAPRTNHGTMIDPCV